MSLVAAWPLVRVLAFTTAGMGHFLPLLPILGAVRDAGHEVQVCAPAQFGAAVQKAGFELVARPDIPPDRMAAVFARMEGMAVEAGNHVYMREVFGALNLEVGLEAARAAVAAFRPDVLVAEEAEVTSRVVAAETGIPLVHGAIGLERFAGLAGELLGEAIAARGLPDVGEVALRITTVPASLDGGGPSRRFRVDPAAAPPAGAQAPGEPHPLIYMTLGSEAGHMPFFPGLAARLIEQLRHRPVQALFTTGVEGPLEALRASAPPNVRVERWVAQDEVMAPAAAVVHHGGFGTLMAALAHGLPSVVVPLFALDQHWNGARVREVGAGVVLDGADAAEQLGGALDEVLANERIRGVARGLAAEIAALPPMGESAALVESLAG